jgi:hypothetical protein
MTNINHTEISRKLALAIGWKPEQIAVVDNQVSLESHDFDFDSWRAFDYRDEVIAFRVAERFDAFPVKNASGSWFTKVPGRNCWYTGATPQLAIALAVIGGM